MSASKKLFCLCLCLALIGAGALAVSSRYNTRPVERQTYSQKVVLNGSVFYQKAEEVLLRADQVTLNSLDVETGQEVQAGDVIATYLEPMSAADVRQCEVDLSEAQDDYAYETQRRERAIADLREEAAGQDDPAEARRCELLAQKEELELERYAASAEAGLTALQDACDRAHASSQPKSVRCGIDGVVYTVSQIAPGITLGYGKSLAGVYDPETALIRVANEGGALKYGMKVEVELSGWNANAKTEGVVVACDNVLPGSLRSGLAYIAFTAKSGANYNSAKVTANTLSVDDALLAPASTVTYADGSYRVRVFTDDGAVRVRYVQCAMQNASSAWILQGVSEGDKLITK